MDMELWFRLLEEGALLSLEAPVCSIRFHEGQMTQENIRSGKLIEDNVCLFREFSGKSYLKVTTYLMIKHKLRMTYRIWISRNNLDYTKRTDMLSQYGLKFVYNFMPIISLAVIIKRIILGLKR